MSINDGVKALDESVTQATENRKSESAEYQELMQSDSAAVDLLGMAKERLNKFYNPDLTTDTTTTTDKYALSFLQLAEGPEAAESPLKEVAIETPLPCPRGRQQQSRTASTP